MANGIESLEHELKALDERIRALNRTVIQTMDDVLALWDLMVELKRLELEKKAISNIAGG